MREIKTHIVNAVNDRIKILVTDEPGHGGASHNYSVEVDGKPFVEIKFQNGAINESGVNGITQEVLLAIVEDRLESFQKGPFSTKDNAVALTHVQTAKLWLFNRTLERMRRGVEGTLVK